MQRRGQDIKGKRKDDCSTPVVKANLTKQYCQVPQHHLSFIFCRLETVKRLPLIFKMAAELTGIRAVVGLSPTCSRVSSAITNMVSEVLPTYVHSGLLGSHTSLVLGLLERFF